MVFIGEASAGPAQKRNPGFLQGVDDIRTDSIDIGDGGIFSDKQTLIDATAKMFGKLAIDVLADPAHGMKGINMYRWLHKLNLQA